MYPMWGKTKREIEGLKHRCEMLETRLAQLENDNYLFANGPREFMGHSGYYKPTYYAKVKEVLLALLRNLGLEAKQIPSIPATIEIGKAELDKDAKGYSPELKSPGVDVKEKD